VRGAHMNDDVTKVLRELVISRAAFPGQLQLTDDTDLLGEGVLDSIGMLSLVDDIETHLDCAIPAQDLNATTFRSVRSLVAAVVKHAGVRSAP
jgi:acyl carrier protein